MANLDEASACRFDLGHESISKKNSFRDKHEQDYSENEWTRSSNRNSVSMQTNANGKKLDFWIKHALQLLLLPEVALQTCYTRLLFSWNRARPTAGEVKEN